ncbi:MAG: TonB-dependent receptor, partial [Deltaproteobacteria bacterium]|nr:TonB-dependent receptor [Deltaproteobacteria bacterium]
WSLTWDLGTTFNWDWSLIPYSYGTYLFSAKYLAGDYEGRMISKTPRVYASNGVRFVSEAQGLMVDFNLLSKSRQRTGPLISMSTVSEWQKGWTTANVSVRKSLYEIPEYGKFTIMASVYNVFNKDYEVTAGYPTPGRAFYLGLGYDFK